MQKIKLGDVLNVKRGASLSGDYYAEEGRYVRLTLGNFNYPGGGFKVNTSKNDIYFVGPIKPEFILNEGDIITPLTEQVSGLLGETATIPESQKYIQSGDVGLVIPDESKLDKRFTYYLIASPIVKKQLGAAAQQTKIRHTSPDAIKACEAWIPEEISVQASIGKLLDSMNEKIANNNLICSNLESMAKLLYDYWFVQFDFPDENGKPYKSSGGKMVWNEELKREIPDGWEVKPLSKVLCLLRDGTHNPPKRIDSGIPLLTGTMFGDYFLDYSQATYITEDDYYTIHKQYKPNAGDIVITKIGTLGNVNYLRDKDIPIAIHCNSALLRFPDDYCGMFAFQYCKSKEFFARLKAAKGQSVQEFCSLDSIGSILMLVPDHKLTARYNDNMKSVLNQMINTQSENQELASLRDFLLPMLMNGQVKVKKEDDNE